MADFDLFVIGAGSGGVRASRVSSAYGARVAVAEEHKVGGTCVIRGCVPKKLLVYGAHFAEDLEDAAMGSITQAMARAAREKGVDILLGTPVEEIIVDKGRAAGVVAGGKAWRSNTVVAGVNPKLLFDRLVPQGAVDADVHSRMHSWKGESATFRMNVALSELPKFTVLPKKGDHLTAGIIMSRRK